MMCISDLLPKQWLIGVPHFQTHPNKDFIYFQQWWYQTNQLMGILYEITNHILMWIICQVNTSGL